MITRFIIAAAVAFFFAPAMPAFAQEHPEHPKKKEETKKSEHPEHPKKSGEQKEVTTAEISTGIKSTLAAKAKNRATKSFIRSSRTRISRSI